MLTDEELCAAYIAEWKRSDGFVSRTLGLRAVERAVLLRAAEAIDMAADAGKLDEPHDVALWLRDQAGGEDG